MHLTSVPLLFSNIKIILLYISQKWKELDKIGKILFGERQADVGFQSKSIPLPCYLNY